MTFDEFLHNRDERIKQVGFVFTEELSETFRNKGSRRTPEKREMLRLIDERCSAAGVTPRKAHY